MADIMPAIGVGIAIGDDADLPVLDTGAPRAGADDTPVLAADGGARLPAGAVLNADRTVTFVLAEPVTIRFRSSAGAAPTEEQFQSFSFRRLRGADMRRIAEAEGADRGVLALALATDTPLAKMTLIYDRMDAADAIAMGEVAGFLLRSGRPTGR